MAEAHAASHFESPAVQRTAAVLGMWVFLATEILLFTGLFTAYAMYRALYGDVFRAASGHLLRWAGTANTFVLITSSLAVALALHRVRAGRARAAALALVAAIALGLVFMGIKAVEYIHELSEGIRPGPYYAYTALRDPGAAMFFTLYFLMTGLHALHVTVGLGVLVVIARRTWKGAYSPAYDTPVELSGMYWHLVDLVWIFLYPLLYLV